MVRKELVEQSQRGRGARMSASFIGWGLTLLVGAALGAYFRDVVDVLTATWVGE